MTPPQSEKISKNKPSNNNAIDEFNSRNVIRQILRKNFPIFLAEAFITFSVSGILLTMVATSWIIFPEEEFHPLEMGILVTARTWSVAVAGLALGTLADRFPRKPIFIGILILAGMGRLFNGFAPNEDANLRYMVFILCNIVVGFGQGGLQPASISYADDAIAPQFRSRFFGIYEIFRQSFQILGMILCTWMFQINLWREYFWTTGIMLFTCAGLVALVIKEPKRGSSHEELKSILADNGIKYRYRITKEMMRTTMLSPTNMIMYVEGVFTWIIISISLFLMYPYLQSPPYNISPFITSLVMVIFGLPGAIFGSITFSRISDKLAVKDIMHRITMIVFSIVVLFISIIIIFLIPFPHLTPEQGNDFIFLITNVSFVSIGTILFITRCVLGLYHINQSPIIQKVNLPEAQGTVSAWNQFLELIGNGLGPLLAGIFLTIYNQNYLLTAIISLLIGLPSAFLWLLARRYVHHDAETINIILVHRAEELAQNARISKQ